MPVVVWKDEYSVGIKVIDDQHKELFNRVNKLFDDVSQGNTKTILTTMDFLSSYVVYHFDAEEQLMAKANYPELENHRKEHEWFKHEVSDLRDSISKDGVGVTTTLKLNKLLVDWLINHVTKTDIKFAPFVKQVVS
ncbi:bacteriohemerythrin [Coprothermobacter platensis]|jgi:hemerythrin|uniref:bacteriohemerythrin n=1 Tax=Coprothermobacter platensis TaxID=108819 RepID=UPI00037505CC|nr:bacteriohemerythrin [Coprothermobacter platensis]